MSASSSSASTLLSISAVRKRARTPASSRDRSTRQDRYQVGGAYQPGSGLARGPQAFAMGRPMDKRGEEAVIATDLDSGTVAVPDPWGEPGQRVQARVNRRVDLLEHELAHGFITQSQYETGRTAQAIFEKATGARVTREPDFGDTKVADPSKRVDLSDIDVIRAISSAREVDALMRRVHLAIGETPAKLLRELLSRSGTVKDYVKSRDPLAGAREVSRIGDRFRYSLQCLDDAFAARGLVVKDAEGNRRIRAEQGETTGEEFDERGRMVRAGRGYRWGRVAGQGSEE